MLRMIQEAPKLFETAADARDGASAVLSSVPAWWEARAARAGLPPAWRDWRRALPGTPLELGEGRVALVGASGEELGRAYTESLPATERLRHGRHYTPPVLANALWEQLADAPTGRVEDPAVGAGALLLPALRRRLAVLRDGSPAEVLARVAEEFCGADLDPCAVWLGNAVLAAELLPVWAELPPRERPPIPFLLSVRDGLTSDGCAGNGVTVLNPPYGRVRLDARARARWHDALYGHANLYVLFLAAAVERTAPGGLIGAVIPTSFLGGAYYQRLRALLAERAPLERLVVVRDRIGVFANGVLQETCLAVFRRAGRAERVLCARQTVSGTVSHEELGSHRLTRDGGAGRPWLLPRRREDGPVVERAAGLTNTLASYGWHASTGPLVWNRHKSQISPQPTEMSSATIFRRCRRPASGLGGRVGG
jgi:adenine-specific DNA-methyltransferase